MKNSYFNFGDFKESLLNDQEKSKIINDYESNYEILTDNFEDTFAYKSYVERFTIPFDVLEKLNVPEVIAEYFDLTLLLKLAFASFSSSCSFKRHKNGKLDLLIAVTSAKKIKFHKSRNIEIKTFKDYLIYNYKDQYESKSDFKNFLSNQTVPLNTVLKDDETYKIVEGVVKNLNDLWSFQVLRLFEIYTEEQLNLFCIIKNEPTEAVPIFNQQMLRYELFKTKLLSKIESPVCMTAKSNILDL